MTSPAWSAPGAPILPDYVRVPRSSLGPAVNDQGYYVGRVERNLYWVTDGDYHSAFLTTRDGVVLFDAPPSIGHNLQRAVNDIAAAEGVRNAVTHLVYTHHHSDHAGASSLFGSNVVRIGHEETRRLLLRDNDPAKPAPEEIFADHRSLKIGGERIELAWPQRGRARLHERPGPPRCPTPGSTSSPATSADWVPATTAPCTSSTSATSTPTRRRRLARSTPVLTSRNTGTTCGRRSRATWMR